MNGKKRGGNRNRITDIFDEDKPKLRDVANIEILLFSIWMKLDAVACSYR
jgi:hypothetical protein